jgi:hypothetical protein
MAFFIESEMAFLSECILKGVRKLLTPPTLSEMPVNNSYVIK